LHQQLLLQVGNPAAQAYRLKIIDFVRVLCNVNPLQ